MLTAMKRQIDKNLAIFLDKIKEEYNFPLIDPILYESIKEFVLRDGKRIRPILLICSYNGYSRKRGRMEPSIYYVSTCIELLHNFMLVHDDIIDRSDLRRGKPTMHRLLMKITRGPQAPRIGTDLAVVAGDIIYALAIDAFLSIREDPQRKERALKYFIQTAVFTAMGEFLDTVNGIKRICDVPEKEILLNYGLKTARYTFDCPLVVGAILAGAPPGDIRALSEFGLLIGEAFQIQDDIIGIFDSEENIGKSVLSDLAESKKTLLVSHAHRHLSPARRKEFLNFFEKKHPDYGDLQAIREIFLDTGSLDYCCREVENRINKAQGILSGLKIRDSYRRVIEQAMQKIFHHSQTIEKNNPAQRTAKRQP